MHKTYFVQITIIQIIDNDFFCRLINEKINITDAITWECLTCERFLEMIWSFGAGIAAPMSEMIALYASINMLQIIFPTNTSGKRGVMREVPFVCYTGECHHDICFRVLAVHCVRYRKSYTLLHSLSHIVQTTLKAFRCMKYQNIDHTKCSSRIRLWLFGSTFK